MRLVVYRTTLIFPIYLASVPCFHHHDQQAILCYVHDRPVFTYAVGVEWMTFCPFDLLGMSVGVIPDTIDR